MILVKESYLSNSHTPETLQSLAIPYLPKYAHMSPFLLVDDDQPSFPIKTRASAFEEPIGVPFSSVSRILDSEPCSQRAVEHALTPSAKSSTHNRKVLIMLFMAGYTTALYCGFIRNTVTEYCGKS